jgi:monofunctional biosynthetic peptidoglycan transglycosylase
VAVLAVTVIIGPAALILVFQVIAPTRTALMLVRMTQGYPPRGTWTSYDAIAPAMRRAVIAGEDLEFCEESLGLDFASLARQSRVWLAGGRPTGASTIAMQTARNLFLWPQRSWLRKAFEVWLAPQLALLWPRRRLLEVYLNVAEFGPGLYGVEAAAVTYFGKTAANLTPDEASELTVLLPNPSHPPMVSDPQKTRARRDWIRGLIDLDDDSLRCAA